MSDGTCVVILAAGKGTRMKSELPKVLHPVAGRAMIWYAVEAAQALRPDRIIVVIGHGAERVQQELGDTVEYALQVPQLGTGHALQMVAPLIPDFHGDLIVTYGDMPLLGPETLRGMQQARQVDDCGLPC